MFKVQRPHRRVTWTHPLQCLCSQMSQWPCTGSACSWGYLRLAIDIPFFFRFPSFFPSIFIIISFFIQDTGDSRWLQSYFGSGHLWTHLNAPKFHLGPSMAPRSKKRKLDEAELKEREASSDRVEPCRTMPSQLGHLSIQILLVEFIEFWYQGSR